MDHRLLCWIRLQQALGYGSSKPMEAYRRHPDLEKWFSSRSFMENEEGLFTQKEMERFQKLTGERCLKIAEKAQSLGQKMLTPDSREYPECLRQISNPPAVLYYVGEFPAVDDIPSIAVVGSRPYLPGRPCRVPYSLPPVGSGRGSSGQRRRFGYRYSSPFRGHRCWWKNSGTFGLWDRLSLLEIQPKVTGSNRSSRRADFRVRSGNRSAEVAFFDPEPHHLRLELWGAGGRSVC